MATSTTTTSGAGILDVANKMVGMQFGPRAQFASELIRTGRQHENGVNADPGDPVKFYNYSRLQPTSDTLSETASGTAETSEISAKSVTLLEKGNFVTTTEKLRSLSFDRFSGVAMQVAQNAAESTDKYAMEVAELQAGASYNTIVGGGTKADIAKTDVLTGDVVRETYSILESANVPRVSSDFGDYYLWFVHPQAFFDLKKQTGDGAFRNALIYRDQTNPNSIIRGEYGTFEGFRFIPTTAVKVDYSAGTPAQTATTVDGAHTVGATTVSLTAATGIVAGNVINITVGSDEWAYQVTGVSTNDVTISKAVRKNGFAYYANDGDGLETALSGGEDVVEAAVVYSNYALGADAFGYAYATTPQIRVSDDPNDAYGRLERVAWYALHGIGEIRPESLHKVYCSSSISPNQ